MLNTEIKHNELPIGLSRSSTPTTQLCILAILRVEKGILPLFYSYSLLTDAGNLISSNWEFSLNIYAELLY